MSSMHCTVLCTALYYALHCTSEHKQNDKLHLFLCVILGFRRDMNEIFIVVRHYVKCTLVQALRLCTGRTAHRGRRGIALL